jgi:hypothetical protein
VKSSDNWGFTKIVFAMKTKNWKRNELKRVEITSVLFRFEAKRKIRREMKRKEARKSRFASKHNVKK